MCIRDRVYPWLLKEIPFDGLILSGGAMVINDGKVVAHHLSLIHILLPDGSFKGPIDKFLVPEKKAELNSMLNLKTEIGRAPV